MAVTLSPWVTRGAPLPRRPGKEVVGRVGEGLTDEHGEDNGSGVAE